MRLADIAQRLPHGAVALEAAAEAELPEAVALAHAARVLDVAQDVPAMLVAVNTGPARVWPPA